MGKVVERKNEKKRRPSLSDFRKRTLKGKQQQKRTNNSAPRSTSNYRTVTVPVTASGPAPLRRSKRLNPNPDADEIRLPSVPVPASGPAPRRSKHRNSNPDADEYQLPSVPVPASGPTPLRPSTRRKPNPDADEIRLPSVPLTASGPAPLRRSTRRNPNPDNILHVEPQRRVGFMTDDEHVRYREQVYKSDGFDVEPMPNARVYNLIQPLDLSDEGEYSICETFSKSAIEKYHMLKGRRTFYKSETPQLKFVRVLKAMDQPCDMIRFYITFEAKDLADEGKHKIYEALVRIKGHPIDVDFSVMFIREYKQDKGGQVIGIHSARELEMQLNAAASMTSRLTILFFSATYPCCLISPLYASLAGKYPKVVFLKVDIDEGHEARDLAACWNISSCPSLFFFKSGKEVDKFVGVDILALEMKIALHSRKQARRELNLDENMNSSVSCSYLLCLILSTMLLLQL